MLPLRFAGERGVRGLPGKFFSLYLARNCLSEGLAITDQLVRWNGNLRYELYY